MVSIAGKYKFVKSENVLEFMLAAGFPEDKAKASAAAESDTEVIVDGNKVTLKNSDLTTFNLVIGEEVEHSSPFGGVIKSFTQLNDGVLTVSFKTADGKSGKRTFQFSDTDLIVTMKGDAPNSPEARRYYKRI